MASFNSLDQLARFAPQIFGRSLSYEGVIGVLMARSGRHDHLDSHTREMREALGALRQLSDLSASGESGRRAAMILAYTHVVCGEEARQKSDTWVAVGLKLSPPKKPCKSPLSPEERAHYAALGLALYGTAKEQWKAL